MKFSWEFNAGNIVTILVLLITLFSKSSRWFISVDKKLDEVAEATRRLSSEVTRNGHNNNAIRQFIERLSRILSSKHTDVNFPELQWEDGSNKSESN